MLPQVIGAAGVVSHRFPYSCMMFWSCLLLILHSDHPGASRHPSFRRGVRARLVRSPFHARDV